MAGEDGAKKASLIYQKKTELEHVLMRPEKYIGSVDFVKQNMWVYDGEEVGIVHREVSFVPGLCQIFDEILVNAADNKVRDSKMDCIKVMIDPEQNMVKIWNNGEGIPIEEHKDEKMYVPTLIFGHLLTSSNYNDEEQKVTGGRNGYGAKLCNVFSKKFVVETATKANKKCFKQVWTENMTKTTEPRINCYSSSEDYTCVTFYPDLERFKMEKLDKDIVALMSKRAYDIAGTTKGVEVYLNYKKIPIRNFKQYVQNYLKGKGNPKCIYDASNERWEVAMSLSLDKVFHQVSFVNRIATFEGGSHVKLVSDQIVSKIMEQVQKKNKGGVEVKRFEIKQYIWLFINCVLKRYDSPEEILREFYTLRLEFYVKRKDYLEGMLEAEARKLTNQARFIREKIDGTIVLEEKKIKIIIDELIEKNYDSDPVRAWNETRQENLGQKSTYSGDRKDFDYILKMNLMSLSRERKDNILREKGTKVSQLEELRKKSPADLWTDDLDLFMEELMKTEARENR